MTDADRDMRDQPMAPHLHRACCLEVFAQALYAAAHDGCLQRFGREDMPAERSGATPGLLWRPLLQLGGDGLAMVL